MVGLLAAATATGAAGRGPLLGLHRIGQRQRRLAYLRIGVGDRRRIWAGDRAIEPSDRRVKALPQLRRSAPARSRTKLIWRLCDLRPGHRPPRQTQKARLAANGRLLPRRGAKLTKTRGEPGIGRCEAVRAQRPSPQLLGGAKALQHKALSHLALLGVM